MKEISIFMYTHYEPISEASYLSAQNAEQYRMIMRVFFREYERMHFQLYKEDVYSLLLENTSYDYPMEQLKLDLEALVRWKNLSQIQDSSRVNTIAEYKNKQFRYTMTENAVEIERMTIRLENLYLDSGNLSTNLFLRLEDGLEKAQYLTEADLTAIHGWWDNLQEDFRRLNQQYQNYLSEFYSGKSEKIMKSVEFVLHKDRFIQYLSDFIQELQHRSRRISNILNDHAAYIEEELLPRVIAAELDIPRTLVIGEEQLKKDITEQIYGRWDSLKNWFWDHDGRESECKIILHITNDIIRSIISNASMIVQMQNWGVSRKDDYLKFLSLFLRCEDINEAHKLSAHVFGVQQIAHFKEITPGEDVPIHQSIFDGEPQEYVIKPRTRHYREKKERKGFYDKSLEKLMLRQNYLKEAEQEKELVMRYIRNNRLIFSHIDDIVSERTRSIFLSWISQANMSPDKKGRTEYGQEFVLKKRQGSCLLHCEDGDLTMPCYELHFR